MSRRVICAFLFSLIFVSVLSPETIHVPADAETIQEGINRAGEGDTVLVAPGLYRENINFMGKKITVASHYYWDADSNFIKNTIIEGIQPVDPDSASCVSFVSGEGFGSVLQGFTLTGGMGTVRREPNNTAWREGGGIFIKESSPTIKNNLIIKNEVLNRTGVISTGGGGISCVEGNPRILNNIIMLNQARYAAGIMLYRSGVVLQNNIICQNHGGQDYGGGGLVMESNGPGPKLVENNTIVANSSFGVGYYGGRAGGLLVFKTSVEARNNIIWGNIQTNGGQIYIHRELTTADFTYCDIEGGWDGEGNIDTNPEFEKAYFYLSEESPCIDAGNTESRYNDPAMPSKEVRAKNPAKGTRRNDIGAHGGPGSAESIIPDFQIPATAYGGVPSRIPGRIETEAFDWDSNGEAYRDNDSINRGGVYRLGAVDIEKCDDFGGGYNVFQFQKGEWLNYSVNIVESEKYDISVRIASEKGGGRFHLELAGHNLTGSVKAPDTGGRQKWQRVNIRDVELPIGSHVIRLVCEEGNLSINALQFSYAASTLPPPWENQDIGGVSEEGRAGVHNGVYYVEGSGAAQGYQVADECHFVFQKVTGDIEIIARIIAHEFTHEWGRAGVMIRESLADNAKFANVGVTLMTSPVLFRRIETGERIDVHNWLLRADYNWLKLTRVGDVFTGFKSRDGVNWIELEENAKITMPDKVLVGLMITSQNDGIVGRAAFDNVQVKKFR